MSDVFILGAGFSKAADPRMPLMSELWDAVVGPDLVEGRLPLQAFDRNVELLLTYLSQRHPWQSERQSLLNRAAFIALQTEIARAFEKRELELDLHQSRPEWLSVLISHWGHVPATVMSLNYDTCVEEATLGVEEGGGQDWAWHEFYGAPIPSVPERVGRRSNGGLGGPKFQLLKLHGSSHWRYSGESDGVREVIYRLPLAGYMRERDEQVFPVTKGGSVGLVPFIVPMVADKSSFYQSPTLRSIWSRAAASLSSADRVYCMGYSLPPTDTAIRYLLACNQPQQQVPFYLVSLQPDETHAAVLRQNYESALSGTNFELRTEFVTHGGAGPIPDAVAEIQRNCGMCGASND